MQHRPAAKLAFLCVTLLALGALSGILLSARFHLLGDASAAPPPAAAGAAVPAGTPPSFVQLAKQAGPAVVNINVKIARPTSAFDVDPFGGGMQYGEGLGTGFFISADGYILTNDHVVGQATAISVALADGREFAGRVVGTDPRTDIALIKVDDKKPFPYVKLGDSDKAEIGEWVVAIGNPFGLDHTVTAGIISAKGRRNVRPSGRRGLFDFIQTDASINPGNSGGPLLNLQGEVIGINAAVNAQGQGIGFAIPVNMAKTLLPMLRDHGKVQRSYLGVGVQDMTRELAKSLKLPEATGAVITKILPESPAAKAGLKVGDVVVSFEGKPVKDAEDLTWLTSTTPNGKTVSLGLSGQRSVRVTLAEMPEESRLARGKRVAGGGAAAASLGLDVDKVTPDIAPQLGLDQAQGVVVMSVAASSPAAGALVRGDVILSVNDRDVNDEETFAKLTARAGSGDSLRMLVIRQGVPMWLAFTLP
jgi:serine protease Do